MASSRSLVPVVLITVGAFVSGCFLDAGAFESGAGATSTGTGGAAGSGSSGGAGSTGGGGGATTGMGGTAGSGGATTGGMAGAGGSTTTSMPVPCGADTDCPDPPEGCRDPKCDKMTGTCTSKNAMDGVACSDPMDGVLDACHVGKCKMGQCKVAQLPKDTLVPEQTDGDCQKQVCDDMGNVVSKDDNADVPEASECASGMCAGGEPVLSDDGATCDLPIAGQGGCCKGTCCETAITQECGAAGCCFKGKTCGAKCCNIGETCCGGTQCCAVCLGGNCVL